MDGIVSCRQLMPSKLSLSKIFARSFSVELENSVGSASRREPAMQFVATLSSFLVSRVPLRWDRSAEREPAVRHPTQPAFELIIQHCSFACRWSCGPAQRSHVQVEIRRAEKVVRIGGTCTCISRVCGGLVWCTKGAVATPDSSWETQRVSLKGLQPWLLHSGQQRQETMVGFDGIRFPRLAGPLSFFIC